MSVLDYENTDGIATITMNNQPQNRLSNDLMTQFGQAIMDIAKRNDTRVVCVKSKGPDFSFGGDVNAWPALSKEEVTTMMKEGIQLANVLEDLPIPIIMAVHGHCLGGGFELALRGDIIIATDDAKFGHPEATIGTFTLLGGIQRVADRVGRTRAMQWALTSELIPAQKALKTGLINEMVSKNELEARTKEWIQKFVSGPTLAHAAHKRLLREWSNTGISGADALMAEMAGESLMTSDAKNSILSAVEALKNGKPRPKFPFQGK